MTAQLPALQVKSFLAEPPLDYQPVLDAMRAFTRVRTTDTADELWILEHSAVYTLGQAADRAHILNSDNIPVVKVDRGGQVTFHGPGQLMFYLLADLHRLDIGVRRLVEILEESVIETLAHYGVHAVGDRNAPGVYVEGEKIAALGLRISRGCSYHGLCLNYDFDPAPFFGINPCGYAQMKVTQIREQLITVPSKPALVEHFIQMLSRRLGYLHVNEAQRIWSNEDHS